MKRAGRILSSAAALMLAAGAASAADVPVVINAVAPPPPAPPPAAVFDWGGLYLGAHAGAFFVAGLGYDTPQLGVQIGYNFTVSNFLLGVEAQVGHDICCGFDVLINARAGVLLGNAALIYGELGVLVFPGFPPAFVTAGGGVEFGIGRSISAFAEVKLYRFTGPVVVLPTVGINWHPGN